VQRRGPPRAAQHRAPAVEIEIRHLQRRLDAHVALRTDAAEEAEGLVIAAEQDVLAVVDQVAGFAIAKGGRAPAQLAARFEHDHAPARLGQRRCRRESGDPAAHHRYVEFSSRHG
jgi:hypothetical protein